jgi:bifunctional pyridoxal-dependent enzyme with beta-cystathionase and maltose regulon repressor activities
MFKKSPIETKIDEEIINLLELMDQETGYTDKYEAMVTQVSTLMELRHKEKISKDTWVTVGTHIAGILVILGHERAHVIASKTFSFVKKIV